MPTPEEFTNALAGCDMPEAIEADFLAELARLEADAHSSGQASPRPRDASTSSSAVATVTVAIS